MLTHPWENRRVLDLFSGTGSLGLEALSRGAEKVVFVENAESALGVLRKNVSLCGFDSSVTILAMPVVRGLARLERSGESFHVIFADPPYAKGWVTKTIRAILAHPLLSQGGVLVMEHAPDECTPETIGNLVRFAQRTHGDTVISLFRFEWPEKGQKTGQARTPTSPSKEQACADLENRGRVSICDQGRFLWERSPFIRVLLIPSRLGTSILSNEHWSALTA
jgi:16S rRNA (guanine(966)-N(2))-methyltransferase RsmD